MRAGDALWVILCLSVGVNVALWMYYRKRARRHALAVFRTTRGATPLLVGLAWSAPLYATVTVYLFAPSWMEWARISVPGWARMCGAIVAMLTPTLCWWVLHSLGNNVTEAFAAVFNQELVTRGPYKYVRHPLYELGCIFLISVSLVTADCVVFAFACLGIIIIRLVVVPSEEEYLLRRFGKSYEAYRRRTGMFVPKLSHPQT